MPVEDLQTLVSEKLTADVVVGFTEKRSGLKDVKIVKFQLGEPTKKGESYGGIITRFTLDVTGKNERNEEVAFFLPVITKSLPPGLGRRKTMRCVEFFRNEGIFYEKVWPAMQQFQNSKNLSKKFDNIPTVLSLHIDGENDYIAMEDLSYQDFKTASRDDGLDYDHTMLGMKMFAEFHALSLAFKDQQPDLFEATASSLQETLFSDRLAWWYGPFQRKMYEVARDSVEKELPQMYLKKLTDACENDLYKKMCESCAARGPLAVVTHGDIWLPNFLVQYDDREAPKKMVMLDFPIARYATLGDDLVLMLFVCSQTAMIDKHWNEFLQEYHKTLGEALERLGTSRSLVSLEDVYEEVKRKALFGVGWALDALTQTVIEGDDVSDLNLIEGDDAVPLEKIWIVEPFKKQEQRKRMADFFKFIVDKGII